jgi:hypothetical protein
MARPIHVVVTCTQSKKGSPPKGARARELPSSMDVGPRCSRWMGRLEALGEPVVKARNMYSGGHWSVAVDMASHDSVELWIMSAGYGLLSLEDCIQAYDATFSSGADCVVGDSSHLPQWWEELSKHSPPGVGRHPRTLQDLAGSDPNASLLVAASPPYLAAVQEDLVRAADSLDSSDRLIVVSGGARERFPLLNNHLLGVDARLQAEVGGAMQSLNVRIARDLLQRGNGEALSLSETRHHYKKLQEQLDPFSYPERAKLGDADVLTFIKGELELDPSTSKTRLLRKLRANGSACEQSRFSNLFSDATR